jgi:hypothetical protein
MRVSIKKGFFSPIEYRQERSPLWGTYLGQVFGYVKIYWDFHSDRSCSIERSDNRLGNREYKAPSRNELSEM